MGTNDFLQFATAGGANVEAQATYAADANRTNGNQAGVASSALNNKAIRQANYVASILAQFITNQTGANVQDNTVTAEFLAQLNAAVVALPAITNVFVAPGTWNMPYIFFIASGNASSGDTYTNNSVTYTVSTTVSSALQVTMTGNGSPLASGTLTKASGSGDATLTFYAFRKPVSLDVVVIGGGGGGAGAGASSSAGGAGGNSTFGTSFLTANGGGAGNNSAGASGGAGGTVSVVGSNAQGYAIAGSEGGGGQGNTAAGNFPFGGVGGSNPYGIGGHGNLLAGSFNPGSGYGAGGGGGGGASGGSSSGGGGAGGFIQVSVTSPLSSYGFTVGAGGTAGAGGSGANLGSVGTTGYVKCTARFQ